ncbi:hypothetical protein [Thermogymnomonas acidicola]|uniref:hypothetical protein n=1 Tax=Thermogymnomonas acidicola TaxID=399579 RepID=UPI0013967E62|nr:hypothetical protein [Thermogymnomonas acidicola]
MLEMSEAAAVSVIMSSESGGDKRPYAGTALGVITVMVPTFLIGSYISRLPLLYVRLFSATLLLYFGIRLARSARRSIIYQRKGFPQKDEEKTAGLWAASYSVGLVEAFEAAIVLVALAPPQGIVSTLYGMLAGGVAATLVGAYILKSQVRKMKQAAMKSVVSALLLSFSAFWYTESFRPTSDLFLLPAFAIFLVAVYAYGNHGIGKESAAGH